MNPSFSTKLGMERCTNCGHRWIDYEGARGSCFMCSSTEISECVSLREVREAILALRQEDRKYLDKHAKRTVILKQRYREIAELSLQRAQEVYARVKEHYGQGNLSDKVVDQLILAFRLFSELGVHKSAAACAYMTAMGYAQRGVEKEIHTIEDLNDLVAARQWFMRLGSKEWEAAINLHLGEKAMAAISSDQSLLQTMAQVSVWHFYRARDHYFKSGDRTMVDRLQFDIERATQLLSSYTTGASQIEAAKISAQSTIRHGEELRRGLEGYGKAIQYGLTALGEHIEASGGSLSRALQLSSVALSSSISGTTEALAHAKLRGRSLDKRMSEVGQLIAATGREIPEAFFKPIKELGSKFATGNAGSSSSADLTSEPAVVELAESVLEDATTSQASMKHLDEPAIKLTGTLFDMLISKGIDKVNEQLQAAEAERKRQ